MYARALTKKEKFFIVIGMLAWFLFCAFSGILKGSNANLRYEGRNYTPVTFNQDIFNYDFCGTDDYIEEDETYPVKGGKFDMVYRDGDLYCLRNQAQEAYAYYADDANYHWQLTVLTDDEEKTFDIQLSEEELKAVYTVEKQEKDLTLYFDEIEAQGTLRKISDDGKVVATTELAYYQGLWYWRSEVIDDSQMRDDTWPEYVYPLPKGFGGTGQR